MESRKFGCSWAQTVRDKSYGTHPVCMHVRYTNPYPIVLLDWPAGSRVPKVGPTYTPSDGPEIRCVNVSSVKIWETIYAR